MPGRCISKAGRRGPGGIDRSGGQGFDGGKKPAALLYLLLRHALQTGFHAAGVRLEAEAGLVTDTRAMLREPSFVHVQDQQGSESRYDVLFRPVEEITGQPKLRLGDYIARNIRRVDPEQQIAALERLSGVPAQLGASSRTSTPPATAGRLEERAAGCKLERMLERLSWDRDRPARNALACMRYGWLEPLQPEGKVLTPAELPKDLADEINRRDKVPLMRDSTNEGLIHAPSLNHATTAAVLRNGYLTNEGKLAVNLSSRRVRLALGILEGMRGGQSLGALLGYQFERHVHDNGPLQVRDLVYPMRRAFPLDGLLSS
jgi:hypothetical protein